MYDYINKKLEEQQPQYLATYSIQTQDVRS